MNMNKIFPIPYVQGEHEARARLFFRLPMDFKLNENSFRHAEQVIFLCYTNRSGSNYLSELLSHVTSYKTLGEFFNYDNFMQLFDNKEKNIEEYLFEILKHCKLENKIPVFKISWDQLFFLTKIGYIGKIIINPTFIHLRRRDVLSQVASFYRALKNNKWVELEHNKKNSEEEKITFENLYSYIDIDYIYHCNSMFDKYFNYFSFNPQRLIYEDLPFVNQTDFIEKIAQKLSGKEMKVDNIKVSIKKQSTAHDADNIQAIKNELKHRFFI